MSAGLNERSESLTGDLAAVVVPEARIFCHPSRVANIYKPAVDEIVQKEEVIADETWALSIRHARTAPYSSQRAVGRKAKLRYYSELIFKGKELNLGHKYFYDARFIDNTNIAHLIQHHLVALGLIRARVGLTSSEILVVLDAAVPKMAVDVFSLAGFEVVMTNLPVDGQQVEVRFNEFFLLLPFVREHGLTHPLATETPRKVFISRRASRRIRNENEVFACLQERGYERFYFEEIPLLLQWSLVKNATHIVSIHGAALGALAFRDGSAFSLVEIFSPGFVADCFRKYSAVLGGRWVGCRGKLTGEVASHIDSAANFKKFAFDDFTISPETLLCAMSSLNMVRGNDD